MNGAVTFRDVAALAVGADQPAPVDLDLAALANQPKLNRIPEAPAQPFQHCFVFDGCTYASIVLQKIREDLVRMHRNMAEHIVEDVRFGRVFQGIATAQPGCGWEPPSGQHLEECRSRQKAADRSRVPSRSWLQPRADGCEPRQAVSLQTDDLESVEIRAGRMLL